MEFGQITQAFSLGKRERQNDRYFCMPLPKPQDGWVMAVMDGHDGSEVSEFCEVTLPFTFHASYHPGITGRQVMREVYAKLIQGTLLIELASSIAIAWVRREPHEVVVGFMGNSAVIVIDERNRGNISKLHEVRTNTQEREGAKIRGGYHDPDTGKIVDHQGNGLEVTRALGASTFGNIILREPEIYEVVRPKLVLLSTKGVAKGDELNELHRFAATLGPENDASDIVRWAEHRADFYHEATAVLWQK